MIGLLILLGIASAVLVAILTAMLAWDMRHPPRHTAGWAIARGLPCDPGDLGMKFEEWTLDRPGGVTLPVWEMSGGRSAVSGQQQLTAVLVHGWGHSRIDALQRVATFMPLVDRVVLFDLRGHGDASGGTCTLGDQEVNDLLALIDRLSAGRIMLVGHSMGAVIAISVALELKTVDSRIAGVIAYGPYMEFHRSLIGRLKVAGLPGRPITDLALLVERITGVRPRSLNEDMLRRLQCPLLVIHGVNDSVSPLDHARRIVRAAPSAMLIEIPEAAHVDSHAVHQGAHDAAIGEFVEHVMTEDSWPAEAGHAGA
jgi:3-oxoadipate enol-lactonase